MGSTRCRIRCANARPRSSMSSCAELAVELVVELAVEPRVQVFLSVSVCAGWSVGWLGLAGVGWVWRKVLLRKVWGRRWHEAVVGAGPSSVRTSPANRCRSATEVCLCAANLIYTAVLVFLFSFPRELKK